jgi:hypothetical protein
MPRAAIELISSSGLYLLKMTPSAGHGADVSLPETLHAAEAALKQMGYSRVARGERAPSVEPEFWVQEAGVPRRLFPVFIEAREATPPPWERISKYGRSVEAARRAAIVVVPTETAAQAVWQHVRGARDELKDVELSILILSRAAENARARWHTGLVSPKELLRISTGVVVGLYRRAAEEEGGGSIDFEEMLALIKSRYKIDVNASLGVENDADALWMLYQVAQRDTYAPGDQGANLHMLVVKPTGPMARLPWFAA